MIYAVIKSVGHYIHWPTLFMAVLAFAIMYGFKTNRTQTAECSWSPLRLPTILSWVIGFEHNAVVDVSTIPFRAGQTED